MERPEAQDSGSIILTGFEPEIVLSSVRTVIEEDINRTQIPQTKQKNTDTNSENQSDLRHLRSIPVDYIITDTSWRVLKRCHYSHWS